MTTFGSVSQFGWNGDNGIGERLIGQIRSGVKTATCDVKETNSEDEIREVYEGVGKLSTVVDKNGMPRCVIRITDVFETTFGSPDPRLIQGEGYEADGKKFQEIHHSAWDEWLEQAGYPPLNNNTVLLVELFELMNLATAEEKSKVTV